jgi:hypothetical protein
MDPSESFVYESALARTSELCRVRQFSDYKWPLRIRRPTNTTQYSFVRKAKFDRTSQLLGFCCCSGVWCVLLVVVGACSIEQNDLYLAINQFTQRRSHDKVGMCNESTVLLSSRMFDFCKMK